jgi:hypothetical protein
MGNDGRRPVTLEQTASVLIAVPRIERVEFCEAVGELVRILMRRCPELRSAGNLLDRKRAIWI